MWFVISLVLQGGALFYLNHWLTGNSKAKETILSSPQKKKIKNKETYKFSSQGVISAYSVSYDAKYIAFVDDGGLKIYNVNDKKVIYNMAKDTEKAHETRTNNELKFPPTMEYRVKNLKWLPDRNKLMYALEYENYKGGPVTIDVYMSEVDGSNKTRLAHFKNLQKGTYIKNIALSTMTNLINIQLESASKSTQLYQVDIMSSMKQIGGSGREIGAIAISPKTGTLFAEIYNRKNAPPAISIIKDWSILNVYSGQNNYRMLGIDEEGRLYLGEESVTGITSIYVASVKTETRSYTKMEPIPDSETQKQTTVTYTDIKSKEINKLMDLPSSVLPDKIHVFSDGEIAIDNSPDNDSISLYRDGVESKKVDVTQGKKEMLQYNKYLAILKPGTDGKGNEIDIYNLDITG